MHLEFRLKIIGPPLWEGESAQGPGEDVRALQG